MRFLIFSFLLVILTSCMEVIISGDTVFPENSQSGLFVVNSGNFMSQTASLSYYDFEDQETYSDVIRDINQIYPVGDVGQSMIIHNGLGYVVFNNSNKILIIDENTAELKGKITGLTSPRYMHVVNDHKAYISDLYGKAITIVDPSVMNPEEQQVLGIIDVDNGNGYYQHSTERMVQLDDCVYVACATYDNQVLVIDTKTDELVDSITVAAQPNSLVIDKNENLWVLCDGGYDGSIYAYENPKLFRIDIPTLSKVDSFTFALNNNPSELVINYSGDSLFFINQHIYTQSVDAAIEPTMFIESNSENVGYGKGFYALTIDPYTSHLFVSDAIDNAQPGYVYRFDKEGTPLDTFDVGINPTGFCFKYN